MCNNLNTIKMKAPLTIEYAIENKFTPIDCVKYFAPEMSDDDCDMYLWECTCYPFSVEIMINQLNEQFLKKITTKMKKQNYKDFVALVKEHKVLTLHQAAIELNLTPQTIKKYKNRLLKEDSNFMCDSGYNFQMSYFNDSFENPNKNRGTQRSPFGIGS